MNTLEPTEKDVLLFAEPRPFELNRTCKLDEFIEAIEDKLFHYEYEKELLKSGIDCEILQPGSKDWRKGKISIKIKFTSDSEGENSELDEFRDSNP